MIDINRELKSRKREILSYFRERAEASLVSVRERCTSPKDRASAINVELNRTKETLTAALLQKAQIENWTNIDKLECLLLITYCHIVVMFDSRNSVWSYNNMDFSRRVGELWDPFCQLCFYYPINDVTLFVPPLFSEAKQLLSDDISQFVSQLDVTEEQRTALLEYYNKIWGLVTSGEVQLALDLHFIYNGQKYNVDFKSGFGSNEKGNLNRLLLVANVFKSLPESYKCLLFVRQEANNSYFNTLRNSDVWEAYSGAEAYRKIYEFSGYNLKLWIENNVNWAEDLNEQTVNHLRQEGLLQKYLIW